MYNQNIEKWKSDNGKSYAERLKSLQVQLRRGDKKKIAQRLGVCERWVSLVFSGKGSSTPVLNAAEDIIRERNNIS